MNRASTVCFNIIPSVMFGLLFMSNLQADETAFDKLGEAIAEEAKNKNLPMLSIVLVDADGVVWTFGVG